MRQEVKHFSDLDALSQAALEILADALNEQGQTAQNHTFALALSGGSTPKTLFKLMGLPQNSSRLELRDLHYFWADERCVGPTEPQSNYKLAIDLFLNKVLPPPGNLHRIPGELPPKEAAHAYRNDLRGFFHHNASQDTVADFNLIFLGLGGDGHTASLFPGSPALDETKAWVDVATAPASSPVPGRVTLTYPVINNAHTVVFLVSGMDKKPVLEEILAGT
ncbi:MAG: 6-phosphogluconolactonase, partial [Elusimicrobiota bacterium]